MFVLGCKLSVLELYPEFTDCRFVYFGRELFVLKLDLEVIVDLCFRRKVTCWSCTQNSLIVDLCLFLGEARCSSVVRAFAHGAMGRRIDPSCGGPIELFFVPASAPPLSVGWCI